MTRRARSAEAVAQTGEGGLNLGLVVARLGDRPDRPGAARRGARIERIGVGARKKV